MPLLVLCLLSSWDSMHRTGPAGLLASHSASICLCWLIAREPGNVTVLVSYWLTCLKVMQLSRSYLIWWIFIQLRMLYCLVWFCGNCYCTNNVLMLGQTLILVFFMNWKSIILTIYNNKKIIIRSKITLASHHIAYYEIRICVRPFYFRYHYAFVFFAWHFLQVVFVCFSSRFYCQHVPFTIACTHAGISEHNPSSLSERFGSLACSYCTYNL